MDCRSFRENHVAFVDDTLSGVELVGLHRHLAECGKCAAQDANVRRSLLVFRNLPMIAPSSEFGPRLDARIREIQREVPVVASRGSVRMGGVAAAVVSALLIGYVISSLPAAESGRDIAMPPVFATHPELDLPHVASAGSAMLASVSMGMPIWTAALYAEQAPANFAKPEITLANLTR